MKKLCVVGSLNVDLTLRVPRFHQPGETIFGTDFTTYAGGKGGNQAVAAARLGAEVLMAGRVGSDQYGAFYRRVLKEAGVDDAGVEADPEVATGVALIEVDAAGENRIAVASGANQRVDEKQIDRLWPLIEPYDIFLLQLEIPIPTVLYTARRLREAGKTILLDPAPAPSSPLPEALLGLVDFVTPNESELAALSGMPASTDAESAAAAAALLARGVGAVLAKRGRRGALLVTAEGVTPVPGFAVNAVDTTAAGDSFNAGLAVALARGLAPAEAVRFANAVGALSTTAAGAQAAMPTLAQARALLAGEA